MNTLIKTVLASILGGIVGAIVAGHGASAQDAVTEIRARNFVLLDDRNIPAARLGFAERQTVLQFYNRDSSVALQIGIDPSDSFRFIHFFGEKNRILAALNSVSNGDTTLILGDRGWESRIILGALHTDLPDNTPASQWGLVFRRPGSTFPLLSATMNAGPSFPQPFAGIQVVQEKGKKWSTR